MWRTHVEFLNALAGQAWQDYIFTSGQIVFAFALYFAIKDKSKPPLKTSIPTAAVVTMFAYAFATLSLWVSLASTSVVAVMWWTLAYQKWRQ